MLLPSPVSLRSRQHLFLLLFVVKGRPASDNVLRFPVASKTSGRDECREEKKKTLIALLTCLFFVFFYHFVTFYNFCCSHGNLNLQKEKTLCRELRYSSGGDSSDVRQRVPTEFLRQLSALTAFHGGQTRFLDIFLIFLGDTGQHLFKEDGRLMPLVFTVCTEVHFSMSVWMCF